MIARISGLLLLGMLAACGNGDGIALYFTEQEAGAEPATTRMLITERHLRIDYGKDTGDFILFDRKVPAIYSVNYRDQTVLEIIPQTTTLAPPKTFVHEVRKDPEAYPAIAGKAVKHYRLLTNGAECYDLFAADGLLPEAVTALREYHTTIAGEHASAMRRAPQEGRDACDLANFIFLPTRHLEFGFPVRQKDISGKVRQLVDYKLDQQFDSKLFTLPEGFRHFRASEMRGDVK